MGPPLASFPIVSTSDVDEAEFVLSRELSDLRIDRVRDRRAFRLEMNGVRLGRTMFGFNQFGAATEVNPGQIDDAVLLIVGVGEPSTFEIDGEAVVCATTGAIVSAPKQVAIRRPAGGGIFILRARLEAIEERCREVLDRRPGRSIVYDRSVDLASGVGMHVRRLLEALVGEIQRDRAIVENPLLRAGLDEMLLNALLALPSNYTDALLGDPAPSAASGLVRRAEEFMEANATEPITISDLVGECGCGGRTLFEAFRRYRGYTPMQFLTERRLESARTILRFPKGIDTVASIAHGCGFFHPGRFSQAYRRRFGESPSETLRKASPARVRRR